MANVDARVKTLVYRGFNPPLSQVEIAYRVMGNKIIFTALEKATGAKTSTINAAEEIVRLICEAEGLKWQECEFFDLQTWVGYPIHGHGYFSLDQLIFDENERLWVKSWENRASNTDHPDYLDGVPRQMVKMLIGG